MTYNNSSKVMMSKSDGSLRSAKSDIHDLNFDRAVSSLYYSVFQAVFALMLAQGLRTRNHGQVQAYVNGTLVRFGHLPVRLGKMYNKLMDMRSEADYSDTVVFSKDEVEEYLSQVEEFKSIINVLLSKKLPHSNGNSN